MLIFIYILLSQFIVSTGSLKIDESADTSGAAAKIASSENQGFKSYLGPFF